MSGLFVDVFNYSEHNSVVRPTATVLLDINDIDQCLLIPGIESRSHKHKKQPFI